MIEYPHESLIILNACSNIKNARFSQLPVEHPARQGALYDIGSIQTIHAVRTHHRRLMTTAFTGITEKVPCDGLYGQYTSSTTRYIYIKDIPLFQELWFQLFNQALDSIPAHLATLVMEIEMDIRESRVRQRIDRARIGLAHRVLVAFLVDQVDQDLRAVPSYLFAEMRPGRLQIALDPQCRRVPGIHDLTPDRRHRSACLDMRENLLLVITHEDDDYLLGLDKVACVAVLVQSS